MRGKQRNCTRYSWRWADPKPSEGAAEARTVSLSCFRVHFIATLIYRTLQKASSWSFLDEWRPDFPPECCKYFCQRDKAARYLFAETRCWHRYLCSTWASSDGPRKSNERKSLRKCTPPAIFILQSCVLSSLKHWSGAKVTVSHTHTHTHRFIFNICMSSVR